MSFTGFKALNNIALKIVKCTNTRDFLMKYSLALL